MRKRFTLAAAILQFGAGIACFIVATRLPRPESAHQTFDLLQHTVESTARQVQHWEQHLARIRSADLPQRTAQMKQRSSELAQRLRERSWDYQSASQMRDTLGQIARGLAQWSETFDAEQIRNFASGLGETAKFLDEQVIQSAEQTAEQIHALAGALSKDAELFSTLTRDLPSNWHAAEEVDQALGRLDEGLTRMGSLLDPRRVKAMRVGLAGLETSLSATAEEVGKFAGYKYPVVRFVGWRPEVEERLFWPNGERIAGGLRQATEGVRAAQSELESLSRDLPVIKDSLEQSRKTLSSTRSALRLALERRDKLDPLLRDTPERARKLSEALPKISASFAESLRQATRLRELTRSMHQAAEILTRQADSWSQTRQSVRQIARVLETAAEHLQQITSNREQFDSATDQLNDFMTTLADLLPILTEAIDSSLGVDADDIRTLRQHLDQTARYLPDLRHRTADSLTGIRWLALLGGVLLCLGGMRQFWDGCFAKDRISL